jgi:hypothetical protein
MTFYLLTEPLFFSERSFSCYLCNRMLPRASSILSCDLKILQEQKTRVVTMTTHLSENLGFYTRERKRLRENVWAFLVRPERCKPIGQYPQCPHASPFIGPRIAKCISMWDVTPWSLIAICYYEDGSSRTVRNIVPSYQSTRRHISHQDTRWRQEVPPKRCYHSTRLYGVTYQRTETFTLTAERTSGVTFSCNLPSYSQRSKCPTDY